MKNPIQKVLLTCLLIFSPTSFYSSAQENFTLVDFQTADGGNIEAAFFDAGLEKTVIFAHGAVFDKESWYFLAEKFQDIGISSLSIDFRGYGNSTAKNPDQKYFDILGAIKFLKEKGFKEVDIIGGSMGGAAVLQALNSTNNSPVLKVVLLAPAGGPPINKASISKLFVVSKKEGLYNRVKSIFEKSSEPKLIKEYEGSTHAQHMFKANYSDELTSFIIGFIKD